MGTSSPGTVWVVHLRSAESDPGPIARTTPGTDHVCTLGVIQGQNRLSAGHGYEGSVLPAHTGWTRARQSRVWAATAAAALAVGCNGGGGTAGTGSGALGHVSRLGSLGSGYGGRARHGHNWARARATRARQLVQRQGTARAWRGLKLWARDGSGGNVTENEVALPFL